MTNFLDGPAKDHRLMLKRAARFLRVVDCNGRWDALDQPEDQPIADEKLYAYEIFGDVGRCHILAGKASGFYAIAAYKFVPVQPPDHVMRDTATWRLWCDQQV